jgi:hypothetical protein
VAYRVASQIDQPHDSVEFALKARFARVESLEQTRRKQQQNCRLRRRQRNEYGHAKAEDCFAEQIVFAELRVLLRVGVATLRVDCAAALHRKEEERVYERKERNHEHKQNAAREVDHFHGMAEVSVDQRHGAGEAERQLARRKGVDAVAVDGSAEVAAEELNEGRLRLDRREEFADGDVDQSADAELNDQKKAVGEEVEAEVLLTVHFGLIEAVVVGAGHADADRQNVVLQRVVKRAEHLSQVGRQVAVEEDVERDLVDVLDQVEEDVDQFEDHSAESAVRYEVRGLFDYTVNSCEYFYFQIAIVVNGLHVK